MARLTRVLKMTFKAACLSVAIAATYLGAQALAVACTCERPLESSNRATTYSGIKTTCAYTNGQASFTGGGGTPFGPGVTLPTLTTSVTGATSTIECYISWQKDPAGYTNCESQGNTFLHWCEEIQVAGESYTGGGCHMINTGWCDGPRQVACKDGTSTYPVYSRRKLSDC